MSDDADLEINLVWRKQEAGFAVALAYDSPDEPSDRRKVMSELLHIDAKELVELNDKPADYAERLSAQLFGVAPIRDHYIIAATDCDKAGRTLHVRLVLDATAPSEYHTVRWELLKDPRGPHTPLALRTRILFSRYLSSPNWQRVVAPPQHDLRALVVVVNPRDPGGRWRLAPIDVPTELKRARTALDGARLIELVSDRDAGRRVTLRTLLSAIEDDIDILYLVAHGRMSRNAREPVLFLEDDEGEVDVANASELASHVADLERRPMLAVLCSCESASQPSDALGDGTPFVALGPQICAAGVPAVVAMQGAISVVTANTFMKRFLREQLDHGQVHRAVAEARREISDRPDWWMPVLYSRLKSGRTWYVEGFPSQFKDTWQVLVHRISEKGHRKCTPVVGPGLARPLFGSREEMARRFVENWQLPIARHNLTDLAKVAQYLKISADAELLADEVHDFLVTELKSRHADYFAEEPLRSGNLETLMEQANGWFRAQDHDPYMALARLELPVYVTTSWTPFLDAALTEYGHPPLVKSFDWRASHEATTASELVTGTWDRPLVYHLFGRLDDLDSLVLSEDDYFDWLSAWSMSKSTVPPAVGTALTNRPLMFVGFNLDNWDFRVVLQAIKTFPGIVRKDDKMHVGVQLSPHSEVYEPEAALHYLERFLHDQKIRVFWGEGERFLTELDRRVGDLRRTSND